MTSSGGVRARARAETIDEIKRLAQRQLAEQGAGELSLRAIARELGLVSSAVYRYFASRDD
ncbi:MAG: helix-turn-helix domain-containing protein, partial [Jatrophihabitans sp.]|uniref:helix-turn-helix domain-containing protein n=1 Tax=Jatrophihabitans sp. TaxID=1932789 RepID=UPI003F8038AD